MRHVILNDEELRILIISQYFWPENFRINDVALGLKERGHKITILTGKPNYPKGRYFDGYSFWKRNSENWNGIKIYRTNLLLRGDSGGLRLFLNYFSFAILASIRLLFIPTNFDRIFVFAPSPITQGIPGIVAKYRFKAKNFLWIHDLWPDSVRISGGIKNEYILSGIDMMTKLIYRMSYKLLIQSKGFIKYLTKQNVSLSKIIYYPFYAESFYKPELVENDFKNNLTSEFTLIFAGNIGESQSFNTLIDCACALRNDGYRINWLIFGDGRLKDLVKKRIENLALSAYFKLMGSYPATVMPKFYSCADGLVVSLKRSEIFSVTIPGKLQSYLACGKPIIGSLDGIGAEIIKEANAGFVGSAESVNELKDAVIKLFNLSVDERLQLGNNARQYYEREFEREYLLDKLECILLDK